MYHNNFSKINHKRIFFSNIAIGENTPADATFLDAAANNTPTLASHLTRKDYVDARVTAFSIAFGA
jgi:hypothetical protein